MKREKQKIIELSGRKWQIEKFDALTGSYIAYKVLGAMLPGAIDAQVTQGNAPQERKTMSKQEFSELQMDCLKVCKEVLPSGNTPCVIGANGGWGVADVEDNTPLILLLTVHSLIFNISGFFDGNMLQELSKSFAGMKQFIAPTSMNTPTRQ